ncbi:MAG: hypothetical protein HRU09_08780 [Oligoflexales bacterium]|nr:hypothetical protein [Oligoflexales bacterium]
MAEAKKKPEKNYTTLEDWDQIFLGITQDFYVEVSNCARENVLQVLELSKNFLAKDTHKSLKEFHDLYFGSKNQAQKTESYNNDVSDFVEHLQKKMEAGEDISHESVEDGSSQVHALKVSEKDRLNLSQIQKQMESLITLDKSLKEKLSPILASMQFEDMMRQRLEHLERGYELICKLEAEPSEAQINAIISELDELCSSQSETTEFYEEVKKEEPPTGIKPQGLVFKF